MQKIIKLENFSLFDITPDNIKNDPQIKALIPALDTQLREITSAINQEAIIYNIDNLDEPVLDFLAVQFHADFYDLAGNLEMKREAIKNVILWHMKKGTRWAILHALKMIGIDGEFINWSETGDEPYTFKIKANITGDYYRTVGRDKIIASITRAVNESKAARSLMRELETSIKFSETQKIFAALADLLSGHEILRHSRPRPPDNKIFFAGAYVMSGQVLILPNRLRKIEGKIFSGFATISNINLDLGVSLKVFQKLLLLFEDRIFKRLEQNEKNTSDRLNEFESKINATIELQNKIMIEHFMKLEDLLRWQEEEDEENP